jgi:hypothetical protein
MCKKYWFNKELNVLNLFVLVLSGPGRPATAAAAGLFGCRSFLRLGPAGLAARRQKAPSLPSLAAFS